MRTVLRLSILPAVLISFAAARGADDAPTTGPTTAPVAITWDQAKDHVGETATVTGTVMGIHDFGKGAVLNIGKDFPAPDRFTVYIAADKRENMPKDMDKGKSISVTGRIKMFHNVPEIEGDPAQITTVDAPATQP
jgi:hypothetical protein